MTTDGVEVFDLIAELDCSGEGDPEDKGYDGPVAGYASVGTVW